MIRFFLLIVALLEVAGIPTATAEQPLQERRVMTWVPPYGISASMDRLQESYGGMGMKDGITHLGLQFWQPNEGGGVELVSRFKEVNEKRVAELRDWSRAHGIRVLLCVYNGTAEGWDWDLASAAFDTHREEFIAGLVRETVRLKLDGVDIDFEGKGELEGSKHAFVRFIRELSDRLHAEGKELTVDTFAHKWHAPRRSWWPDLLPHIDGLHVMGYAEMGATAGDWRSYQSLKEAVGREYASKLVIGMPGSKAEWQGATLQEHLRWVTEDGRAGVAIWDARLREAMWRTTETWTTLQRLGDAPQKRATSR